MRNHVIVAVMVSLALSACTAQPQPIKSKCFSPRGDLTCKLQPLPELWAEARQDAVKKVGVYEGAVEDGPYNVAH